jgi:hypothetical protein
MEVVMRIFLLLFVFLTSIADASELHTGKTELQLATRLCDCVVKVDQDEGATVYTLQNGSRVALSHQGLERKIKIISPNNAEVSRSFLIPETMRFGAPKAVENVVLKKSAKVKHAALVERLLTNLCARQRLDVARAEGNAISHSTTTINQSEWPELIEYFNDLADVIVYEVMVMGIEEFFYYAAQDRFVPICRVVTENCNEACDSLKDKGDIACGALAGAGAAVSPPVGLIAGAVCLWKMSTAHDQCRWGCKYPTIECTR